MHDTNWKHDISHKKNIYKINYLSDLAPKFVTKIVFSGYRNIFIPYLFSAGDFYTFVYVGKLV